MSSFCNVHVLRLDDLFWRKIKRRSPKSNFAGRKIYGVSSGVFRPVDLFVIVWC